MKRNRDEQMPLAGTEEAEILTKLNDRVERAIATIGELRRERDGLRKRLEEAESKAQDHEGAQTRLSSLEEEHDQFQKQRGEIRERIESILASLESLDENEEDRG